MALTLAMKTFETRVVGGDTLEPYEATEAFNPLAFIRVGSAQDWTSEVSTDSSQTKARDDTG